MRKNFFQQQDRPHCNSNIFIDIHLETQIYLIQLLLDNNLDQYEDCPQYYKVIHHS